MAVVLLLVAGLGSAKLLQSHAASAVLPVEPEQGSIQTPATATSDSNASSGRAVTFGAPSGVGGRQVNVSTSAQLSAALADAEPGDVISVADGSYTGKMTVGSYTGSFDITKSGTATAPITLRGSRNVVIDGDGEGGHYGMYIYNASYWNISGISVTSAAKGIVLDGGNHITLDSIHVYDIGSEAVHFRSFSSDNVLKNSVIEQTGVRQAQYGEGVYIGSANSNWGTYTGGQPDGSNRNQILNNSIGNTGAENIDIKEGTQDGVISGNHFDGFDMKGENSADSWLDVKGNHYTITDNIALVSSATGTVFNNGIELHQAVVGWGINNILHRNHMDLTNATGAGFYQQKNLTGNILSCDNEVINAPKGFGIYNVSPQACNDN